MNVIQQILNLPLIIKIIIIVFIYFKFFRRENFFERIDVNKMRRIHQQQMVQERSKKGLFSNIMNFFNKDKSTQQSEKEQDEKSRMMKERAMVEKKKAEKKAVMERAMAAKKKAEKKALQQAQKKLIEASKENIKSKIEEKNAELLNMKGNKIEAEKAVIKSITAMKKAIKKADEAQAVIDKVKKPEENKNIFPRGTKKGQILKWDGTKWALGTDNIF